jgi:hypothetical protein
MPFTSATSRRSRCRSSPAKPRRCSSRENDCPPGDHWSSIAPRSIFDML